MNGHIKGILFFFLLFFSIFFISANSVSAHSGRTDSSGGHNCYVGSCAGTYHYHNGGYSPPAPLYIPPPPFPANTDATWKWTSNLNRTYDVTMELDDTNPSQYSAVISKCAGCDPGPSADFSTNTFRFNDVSPGTWYVNVKKEISGRWSETVYWTVEVPAWVAPTPTPKPTKAPTIAPSVRSSTGTTNDSGNDIFLGVLTLAAVVGGGYLVGKKE